MRAWMPLGRMARELGVPRRALVGALTQERMVDSTGRVTSRAVDWGYARLTHVSVAGTGAPAARWHTRRCMRLVGLDMPAGRDWDRLLMAEEIDDVLAECTRLESTGDTAGIRGVLATLDEATCAEVQSLLSGPAADVVDLPLDAAASR